jgi:quinol monooxygenase YgiN
MSVITFTRGQVDPSDVAELRSRHAELVEAVKRADAGLIEARFGRVDDSTWGAIWRWDSEANLAAARENPPAPELAGAAFSLVKDPVVDVLTVDDEG